MESKPQPETALAAIESLGLTMTAEFVPYSKTKDAKPDPKVNDLSLNWRITIKRGDQVVIESPYRSGVGHAPSYNDPTCHTPRGSGRFSVWGFDRVKAECEHGRKSMGSDILPNLTTPITPEIDSVLYCLISDAEAIDHPTFESWASDLGYDPDSRKAESIYRACLETGLKLRAALGDDGLRQLREAFQDY
jgi:hypothetical protein